MFLEASFWKTFQWNKLDKVFKNGPSKICGRQPLKIPPGSFLNTLSQRMFQRVDNWTELFSCDEIFLRDVLN